MSYQTKQLQVLTARQWFHHHLSLWMKLRASITLEDAFLMYKDLHSQVQIKDNLPIDRIEELFEDFIDNFYRKYSREAAIQQAIYLSGLFLALTKSPKYSFDHIANIFSSKNLRYGNSFLKLGMPGLFTRLADKIKRARNLISHDDLSTRYDNESIEDTLQDAANYALLIGVYLRFVVVDD